MEASGDVCLFPQIIADGPDCCVGASNVQESEMKRIVGSLVVMIMVFSLCVGTLAAQEEDDGVLQKARDKYQEKLNKGQSEEQGNSPFSDPQLGSQDEENVPYTPVLLSFAPGISMPFGYYRTSVSCAAIGAAFEASYGFAGAGVFNIYNSGYGFQGAGVFNISGERIGGFQSAGVFNISGGEVDGFQGAGVFNIAGGPVSGAQVAGVFNIAEKVRGSVQIAGVFNIANKVQGLQVANVFNVAESVSGMQIGLVNITGELKGLQIGLINISNNGVDSLSYIYMPATDSAFVYWQAGSPFLYMVVGAGAPRADWFVRYDNLMLSAGLGTRVKLGGPYLDIDVSAEQAIGSDLEALYQAGLDHNKEAVISYMKPYPSARLSLGLPLGRTLHVTGGIKTVVQLEQGGTVPASQRTQDSLSATWFGVPFTAWSQWFFGVKVRI